MKRTTQIVVTVLVLLSLLVPATLSQVRSPSRSRSRVGGDEFGGAIPPDQPPTTAREMAERHQQRMREMQLRMEEMQRRAEESRNRAIQEALGATGTQWRQMKPKLDRIERLKAEADVALDPGSSGGAGGFQGGGMAFGGGFAGGGGWTSGFESDGPRSPEQPGQSWHKTWTWGSSQKSPMDMSEGEVLCADLDRLLRHPPASPAEIAQKVEALRRIRARARQDLARARQELRRQIVPRQEAALILMGYLD
jgi:hypothetical protein